MELSEIMKIELFMKRDGRIFDHQTLESIRLMAIGLVREGELPSDVNASCGFFCLNGPGRR